LTSSIVTPPFEQMGNKTIQSKLQYVTRLGQMCNMEGFQQIHLLQVNSALSDKAYWTSLIPCFFFHQKITFVFLLFND
ncbi:hypothetical protein, partial [Pseudomonas poae]|uniref:hypothetical protein n=1 Tax=Pseudomonas poae TaxID=200451 RepID=UPI0034D63840